MPFINISAIPSFKTGAINSALHVPGGERVVNFSHAARRAAGVRHHLTRTRKKIISRDINKKFGTFAHIMLRSEGGAEF